MGALNEMKPFWMVWGVGTAGPKFRHDTEGSAVTEAERLARQCPGTTFVVLEATQAVRKRDVERFNLRIAPSPRGQRIEEDEDDIPF